MNIPTQLRQLLSVTLVVLAVLMAPVSAIAAQVVDINRADAATMIENWKGIGEKKARAIVAYRKKNGKFSDISELANVKGIGEGLIKNNRKYMSVTKGLTKPSGKAAKSSTSAAKTDSKSSQKKSTSKKSTKKDSAKKSTSKKSTSKKSTSKKSTSKKSKKCKPGSKDKNCKPTKKSKKKKKKSTT